MIGQKYDQITKLILKVTQSNRDSENLKNSKYFMNRLQVKVIKRLALN